MELNNKNILITGGNGMIGRQLEKLLLTTTTSNITIADLPDFDLRDRGVCREICEGQDIVFLFYVSKVLRLDVWNSFIYVPMIQFIQHDDHIRCRLVFIHEFCWCISSRSV